MTTYFSDYILVPHKSVHTVTKTLENRGFTFSPSVAAYVSQDSPSSPIAPRHGRSSSAGNPFNFSDRMQGLQPSTPPFTLKELQKQTFMKLKRAGIAPMVDTSIRLVSCAGRKEVNPAVDAQLRDDLLQILLATCPLTSQPSYQRETSSNMPPLSTRFLSLTLTADEPISLLLESSLLSNPNLSLTSSLLFSQSSARSAVAGSDPLNLDNDILVPVTLDLRDLPLEATGIVCGVAGCLAHSAPSIPSLSPTLSFAEGLNDPCTTSLADLELEIDVNGTSPHTVQIRGSSGPDLSAPPASTEDDDSSVEITFLSTARSGTVIVRDTQLHRAIQALGFGTGPVG
jgi:hypothetical protein